MSKLTNLTFDDNKKTDQEECSIGHRVRNVNKFHGASSLTNINKFIKLKGQKNRKISEKFTITVIGSSRCDSDETGSRLGRRLSA